MLPIEAIRSDFEASLGSVQQLLIHAPPGAGKSTQLPLWLLKSPAFSSDQRFYLIQPRRLAARQVAQYLAEQLGEPLGAQIGLFTRYDKVHSAETRIEVMTEGLFIRRIQADPELPGVAMVIFDEFHERSLQLDLGLALTLQSAAYYRDDITPLAITVMSATLAVEPLLNLLPDALLLRSDGRSYPVTTHYLPVPTDLIEAISQLIRQLFISQPSNVLVFLPGLQAINQLAERLSRHAFDGLVTVYCLHGSADPARQREAIAPCGVDSYKIVLATNVAETSITIDGITTVIDSGLARVAGFDVRRAMPSLTQQRISKAAAEQRRGRAGRTAAGDCYRLWPEALQATLLDHEKPEVQRADLASFALELALWGESDPSQLLFIDSPPAHHLASAHDLLKKLEALDEGLQITARGRLMASLGLHPRLSSVCILGKKLQKGHLACLLAALLSESFRLFRSRVQDITLVLDALLKYQHSGEQGALQKGPATRLFELYRQMCKRLNLKPGAISVYDNETVLTLLLAAYPDRLAKLRDAKNRRYLLVNGQEAYLRPESDLSCSNWLMITELSQSARGFVIQQAMVVDEPLLISLSAGRYSEEIAINWEGDDGQLIARKIRYLGAIVTASQAVRLSDNERVQALVAHVRDQGLACLDDGYYRCLLARYRYLCSFGNQQDLSDIEEKSLLATTDIWLRPHLSKVRRLSDLKKIVVGHLVWNMLSWGERQCYEKLVPEHFKLPTGRSCEIDYLREQGPTVAARMQEFYGLQETPCILGGKQPLLLELLSPAMRPLQITKDLAGFWSSSYQEVAKEMRGRYPKHFWPESPATASATDKTKKAMQVKKGRL